MALYETDYLATRRRVRARLDAQEQARLQHLFEQACRMAGVSPDETHVIYALVLCRPRGYHPDTAGGDERCTLIRGADKPYRTQVGGWLEIRRDGSRFTTRSISPREEVDGDYTQSTPELQ